MSLNPKQRQEAARRHALERERTSEQEGRVARADRAAEKEWENEGGATKEPAATSVPTPPIDAQGAPGGVASRAMDARQDELMTIASSDGRPPTRRQRMREWRWFALAAVLITSGLVIWISVQGVRFGAVIAGLAFGLILLAGAAPVLVAGVLRGREERAAGEDARSERPSRRIRRLVRRALPSPGEQASVLSPTSPNPGNNPRHAPTSP